MAKASVNISTGTLQRDDIIVGIDLGTTNSLVAFIDSEGNPRVVNDNEKGILVPSIIHFDGSGNILVGNEARPFLISDPNNTIFSAKRLIGRSYKDIENYKDNFSYRIIGDDAEGLLKIKIGDRLFSAIELSSLILKELKKRAEHALKSTINHAVITVPAYFNDSQRQATRDAGKLAGLDVLRIVNEPTAASLAYGIGLDPNEEKIIAIYDLGGGTFDVSILKIQNGIFEVLSTHGNTFLGGDDFDRVIVNYWIEQNKLDTAETALNTELTQGLRLKAEEAKKALSKQNIYVGAVGDIPCAITRQKFEELITAQVQETISACKDALSDANLSIGDINEVIMVGGSIRTPLVKKLVSDFFGKSVHDGMNPDEVVATGAAIQADILAGNRKDMVLLDVTPLSLGIETIGGLMDVIIPRNSKIPAKTGRQYTTSVDGQINLKISIFQGERDLVKENRKLAEFDLKGIPPMPAGFPKIDINFLLNADGILKIQAVELRSGVKQEVDILPAYGLTIQKVEEMLSDSVAHASDDLAHRATIEAHTEGAQVVYLTERFIIKNASQFSNAEIELMQTHIQLLKESLESSEPDLIRRRIKELNEYTRPFAERVMDEALSYAIKGKAIE